MEKFLSLSLKSSVISPQHPPPPLPMREIRRDSWISMQKCYFLLLFDPNRSTVSQGAQIFAAITVALQIARINFRGKKMKKAGG